MDNNNISDFVVNEFYLGNEIDLVWIGILEVIVLCFIMLVVVVGNFLVIVVVYCWCEFCCIEIYIFIVNLSLMDIFVVFLCMLFFMIIVVIGEWIFGNVMC